MAACRDQSATEDPVLAHFAMALDDIVRSIERKQP